MDVSPIKSATMWNSEQVLPVKINLMRASRINPHIESGAPILAWSLELQELLPRAKLGTSSSSPASMIAWRVHAYMCSMTHAVSLLLA